MDEFEKALEIEIDKFSHISLSKRLNLFQIGNWAREWLQEDTVMKLAGISTACIQNTERTIKDRIDKTNPYWTVAYGDVCDTVDREMKLRTENSKLRGALEKIGESAFAPHLEPIAYEIANKALKETGGDDG